MRTVFFDVAIVASPVSAWHNGIVKLVVFLACTIASTVVAVEVDIEGLVARAKKQRQAAIQSLYQQREDIRVRKNLRAKDRRTQIQQLNQRILELADPQKVHIPHVVGPLNAEVGMIVKINDREPIGWFDTIDKNNMVVGCTYDRTVSASSGGGFKAVEAGTVEGYRAAQRGRIENATPR